MLCGSSFVALVLMGVVFFGTPAAAQNRAKTHPDKSPVAATPENTLQQHYDAGRTFQLSGDQDRAAAEYRVFLAEALRQIANANSHAGEFDHANSLFAEAARLAPGNAEINLDFAAFQLQQENPKKAQTLAETAVRLAPNDAQAQYMLGSALFHQQNYEGAKEHLEKAVVAEPKFEVGYLLGMTYIKLNDLNRATVLFNEMVLGLGDTAQLHVLLGRAYREGDFLDQAVAELKKAIMKDGKIKVAHYLLAMAYLERDGDSGFVEALPELEAELKVNSQDARTHYMLGYIALKRRDSKQAEAELGRAAELDSQNPDPLVSLGQLYVDAGRLAEAEKAFRRAILLTKDPSRNGYQINRAHYGLARLLLQTGREEEGKKELQISAELRDKPRPDQRGIRGTADAPAMDDKSAPLPKPSVSADELKKVDAFSEELKPAIADSYNNLGVIAAGKKDYSSAMDYFAKAGEWNSSLETLDRNLGMAAFYANEYPRAVVSLGKHLDQHPDDLRARAALGLSLFGVQNYQKVLEVLQPIQQEVDGDPGLSYAYAVSQVKTGAYNEGIARLRALEKADPNSADVHSLLGQAFADQGQYAEALDEYRSALAIDPNQERTHFLAGLALIRNGDPAKAEQELRVALKLDPADINSKYHLAYALIQMQRQQEALPLLQEVIQQNPKHGEAYYQLGKMQLERGDARNAISNLEAGARLSPDSDYMHYQLALAYRRDARAQDAEREMKVYQALKSRHRGRDAARDN
ncbi:MAG: tetratricopeptide repeat protein [Acidobacteriota bacterium]|nr:tetratricopeptide repeat protein [Acidobacteriota bacterium]